MVASSCPDPNLYTKLATGQVPSSEAAALLDHLQGCPHCVQRLEKLSDRDTLIDLIRQAQTLAEGPAGETVARLVAQLQKLTPTTLAVAEAADTIRLNCTACGKSMKIKAALAGKKVKCPHCQAVLTAPPLSAAMPSAASYVAQAKTMAPGTAADRSATGTASDIEPEAAPSSADRSLYDFLAPAQATDELGRLGPYRILKVLGAGGMGVVFQAEDPGLQRLVALKAMLPSLATSESAKERFLREARAAAKLKHDHIVTIHQVGEDRGAPFLAMEFLEGEPLDERLKREGKLPTAEILRIGREMAEGLAAAHARGLIHRDIKPANVWLESRSEPRTQRSEVSGQEPLTPLRSVRGSACRVKILDFGLARASTSESQLTQSGAIVGTPAYMAPEQAQGKIVDARCDLFSLGCVLYRMATGEPPFKGTDMISTLVAVSTQEPPAPVSLNFELPTELSDFIMQLLAKEPSDRPESAQAVVHALEQMAEELEPSSSKKANVRADRAAASPGKRPATKVPATSRGRRLALAGVGVALLVGLGVWLSGLLVRVETKDGILTIKTDDPTVAVKITPEGGATLTYGKDRREINLKPGKYGIELAEAKEGLKLTATQFTLSSGENRTIEVRWEKAPDGQVTGSKPSGKDVAGTPAIAVAPFDEKRAKTYQEAWAKHLGRNVVEENSIGMKLVLIPPGKFLMGSPESDKVADRGEKPQHEVELTQPFQMAAHEITQEQFEKIMGRNPSAFSSKGTNSSQVKGLDTRKFPVETVTWYDAVEFCIKLSEKESKKPLYELTNVRRDPKENFISSATVTIRGGIGYRLPTEAEWEFACRAGTTTPWFFGNTDATLGEYAWYSANSSGHTHPVGEKKPNAFGLYDMHGNVWEWCQDWYGTYTTASLQDPTGPKSGPGWVLHGGVWNNSSHHCRSAFRGPNGPLDRKNINGFRVVWAPITVSPTPGPVASPAVAVPKPSPALEALRREQISPEALAAAGGGDAKKAPAQLVAVLGQAQPIHQQWIHSAAFSPDGRWFATASYDHLLLLRDAATGQVRRTLRGHSGAVIGVAFSKDSQWLLSAAMDNTLRLWSLNKDEPPRVIQAKLDPKPGLQALEAFALSADGRYVAAAGDSGLVKIWKWGEWETPTEIKSLVGKVMIRGLDFSPDGDMLAAAGVETKAKTAQVRLFTTAAGVEKQSLPLETNLIMGVAFSHDGKHVAAVGAVVDGRVWEVSTGKPVMSLTRHCFGGEWNHAYKIAWSPDDKKIALGAIWRAMVYDFPSGKGRSLWFGVDQPIRCVAFSPKGDMLAAGGEGGDLAVWNTATWELAHLQGGHRRFLRALAVSPDGEELLSVGDEMALLRWDLSKPMAPVVRSLDFGEKHQPRIQSVFWSRDGKSFFLPSHSFLASRDRGADKENLILTGPVGLHGTVVTSNGLLAAGWGGDGHVHLWDLNQGRAVHRFPPKGQWNALAFSGNDELLTASDDKTKQLWIWNVDSGAEFKTWQLPTSPTCAAFSPDRTLLATGHQDGHIHLWRVADGSKARNLPGHTGPVQKLKFDLTGQTLVSSGSDGTLRVWNPAAERARDVIAVGPTNGRLTFDLDPSGAYVFAGGQNPLIFVLRLSTNAQAPPDKTGEKPPSTGPAKVIVPTAAPALDALRREQISPEALAAAGGGDAKKAPASLVAVLGEVQPLQMDSIRSLAFSPDGRWLASACQDHTIFLREGDDGKPRRVLRGHKGSVEGVAFAKDSKTLASASADGTVRLWPVETEAAPQVIEPKLGPITALAASADGRFLAVGGTSQIILWKWGAWDKPLHTIVPKGRVTALAMTGNGEMLAVGTGPQKADCFISLHKTSTGELAHAWPAHKESVDALSYSPDGKVLASTGGRAIKIWESPSGKPIHADGTWGHFRPVAFHGDGKRLFMTWENGVQGQFWELATKKTLRVALGYRGHFSAAAFRPDGKRMALSTHHGVVELRDVETWEPQAYKKGHAHFVDHLAAGPDGTLLTAGDDYTLRRWDLARPGENKLLIQFDRALSGLALNPDGKTFVTSAVYEWYDLSQRGVFWDAASGKRLFAVDPPSVNLWSMAYSPDGKMLAGSAGGTASVFLWDSASGKQLHQFPIGDKFFEGSYWNPPVFSGDGKLLAASHRDKSLVKIWNVATGDLIHSLENLHAPVLAFNYDGQLLATGHDSGNIGLWDFSTGKPAQRLLTGHTKGISKLKFTPDGKTLVSSSHDSTIRLWDPAQPRALREIIALGPGRGPLYFDLDPSGRYLFVGGFSPLVFVLRLDTAVK